MPFPDLLFADVRVVFAFDNPAYRFPIVDAVVAEDQPVEFRPVLGVPPHSYHRVGLPPEMPGKIIPERIAAIPRQRIVSDIRAFRRRGSGQRDAVDVKFFLIDKAVHQRNDPAQLPAVVAERIGDGRIVRPKRHEIPIPHDRVLVDHFDLVSRQRIDEREHRGNRVFDRVRGRQPVTASIEGLHPPVERYGKLFAGVLGFHVLRVIVNDRFVLTDDRIQPGIGRIRELYQLPVRPLDPAIPIGRIGAVR